MVRFIIYCLHCSGGIISKLDIYRESDDFLNQPICSFLLVAQLGYKHQWDFVLCNIIGSWTNIPYLPNGLKKSLFFLRDIYIQQPMQEFIRWYFHTTIHWPICYPPWIYSSHLKSRDWKLLPTWMSTFFHLSIDLFVLHFLGRGCCYVHFSRKVDP